MNRRGMDGWMGRGREREREMYFIVVFSNSLAGERKGWSTQSLRVGRKKGERGKKRERKKRKKRKSRERASGMDENREASALRRGYIYGERLDARLLGVRFFCFVFAFVCLFLLARVLFRFIFFLPQDTSRRRQRRCYDYFESSIITFPSWPRTNITTTGIFRYLQTNIR